MADKAIAKFFYANARSFGAADSKPDSYYHEMVTAIKNAGESYVRLNCSSSQSTCLRTSSWHGIFCQVVTCGHQRKACASQCAVSCGIFHGTSVEPVEELPVCCMSHMLMNV